jgi:peptidoglycan/LPS O-acetylase OafA/YrhL
VLVLAVGSYALQRRRESVAQTRPAGRPGDPRAKVAGGRNLPEPFEAALLVLGVVLGALLFAGSLADGHHESWPGIIGGIACAALGYFALAALFGRARRRLAGSGGAVTLLGLYADGIALVLAGLSILFPPIAYAALVVFLVLIARSRSESAQKYEGLRSLR